MEKGRTDWQKAVEFHGHVCPGLAIGFRVAQVALEELAAGRASDEELVAIVENDACGIDAIQVLTGCTLGKGNLIYRDRGKQAYTFGDRKTGKAFRIVVKEGLMNRDERHRLLMERVMAGTATPEERAQFQNLHRERAEKILAMAPEEFCTIKDVDLVLPEKARIFSTVTCSSCGEGVMESRARLQKGKPVCLDCAGEYTRGWGM